MRRLIELLHEFGGAETASPGEIKPRGIRAPRRDYFIGAFTCVDRDELFERFYASSRVANQPQWPAARGWSQAVWWLLTWSL
jgi:hypothetical protein